MKDTDTPPTQKLLMTIASTVTQKMEVNTAVAWVPGVKRNQELDVFGFSRQILYAEVENGFLDRNV